MAKETAEQKLLRLIESTESRESQNSPGAQSPSLSPRGSEEAQKVLDSVRGIGFSSMSVPSFGGAASLLRIPLTLFRSPASLGLKEINQLLIVFIVFFAVFFVKDFIGGMQESQSAIDFGTPKNVNIQPDKAFPDVQSAEQYAQVVARRNIFQPYQPKVVANPAPSGSGQTGPAAAPAPANQAAIDVTKDLKLVGISWLSTYDSETAMIEDNKTQVTHFLRRGDVIKGAKVENIYADQVILSYNGQTVSLKL